VREKILCALRSIEEFHLSRHAQRGEIRDARNGVKFAAHTTMKRNSRDGDAQKAKDQGRVIERGGALVRAEHLWMDPQVVCCMLNMPRLSVRYLTQ
jgi:hypothetical protein